LNVNPHHEHEFEAAPGLPEPLPANERLLWQGAPQWRQVAVHVFHVRTLAWYFAAMMLLQATYLLGEPERNLFKPLLLSFLLSVISLGILSLMAWLTARTALYTLTNKRVVMRIGVVLTLTVNLPLRMLAAASLKTNSDGTGDIALKLAGNDHIAWLNLWPHARPWALRRPEPSLRCISDVASVGERILKAWQEANPHVPVMLGDIAPPSVQRTPANTSPEIAA
jgi:predicted metal-dependent hydrolase